MTAKAALTRSRRLPLHGAVNCRDLGGYKTADGRAVRWNMLYRSDSLAEISDDDIKFLSEIGLRTIFDFRHEVERRAKPNKQLIGNLAVTHTQGFLPYRAHELVASARSPGASVAGLREQIKETYRRFVIDQTPTYRLLFELLAQPENLPMLFHCTSGKDRTGFAAALILSVLGVPNETIVEDYILSNEYRRDLSYLAGSKMPAELLAVMEGVHPAALEAAFEEMTKTWLSPGEYLEKALGVTPEMKTRLQNQLLEPAS